MRVQELLTLLQLSDSAFPTGTFAHSAGLEMYTQREGFTAEHLESLLMTRVQASITTDLILIRLALDAPLSELVELDVLCSASKSAAEARHTSEKVGWRLLDNAQALYPSARLATYRTAIYAGECIGNHAVVHGVVFGTVGIVIQDTLLAWLSGLVMQQAFAAVKLMSMGQSQAQSLIRRMQPALIAAVQNSLTLRLDDYGSFTPGLDIAQMQHATLDRRLFIS